MKILKNVVFIIICIFILLFLLLNIFSALDKSFLGFRIFKVGSGSMEPTLHINDIVIIKKQNEYKKEDIITFRSKENYITHRLILVDENQIITKGDANNTQDTPIHADDIIGKLVFKLSILGFLSYLFTLPLFWALLFLIGIIVTILLPDKYLWKNDKKRKEKKSAKQ